MSQAGTLSASSIGPAGPVTTLTGNSGGAVPPTAGNINILGAGTITVAGNPGTSTLTITNTAPSSVTSFSAYANADIANVTGDTTDYTVVFNTEISDIGGNYNNATGVFTAPSTGLYFFASGVTSFNYTALFTSYQLTLFGSVYHVTGCDFNPGVAFDGGGANDISQNVSAVIPMTAGDTMRVILGVDGSTKTIGIHGAPAPDLFSWFTGYKIA